MKERMCNILQAVLARIDNMRKKKDRAYRKYEDLKLKNAEILDENQLLSIKYQKLKQKNYKI